jgi:high affinity Mn2+ porin
MDAAINQLRATTTANRIVITAGKMGVGDIFDTNKYAHDPRGDFLNWSLVDTGSFDYAANAWGYTYGVARRMVSGAVDAARGLYNLSKVPNGVELESNFRQNALIVEGERRFHIGGREGAVRVTGSATGACSPALTMRWRRRVAGAVPDLAPARRKQDRLGIALNAEQEVTGTLGVPARGASDGAIETYDFTDIDRTLALGGALKGKGWGRPQDTGWPWSSTAFRRASALAGGGRPWRAGRWRLPHPGDEQIIEAYYAFGRSAGVLTFDYQHIANPGYNRDRGPANVFALRVHAGF